MAQLAWLVLVSSSLKGGVFQEISIKRKRGGRSFSLGRLPGFSFAEGNAPGAERRQQGVIRTTVAVYRYRISVIAF